MISQTNISLSKDKKDGQNPTLPINLNLNMHHQIA